MTARRHRGRWRRDASKCNFMPQFFSFRSCRPAKVSSALEDRLIFSSWFCIFPRGNKLADQASATRELRINVFDVQYYRSIDDCDSYCITQKYRTFYKKNFSLSFEYQHYSCYLFSFDLISSELFCILYVNNRNKYGIKMQYYIITKLSCIKKEI